MLNQLIAVLGGGNIGHALAADLTLTGRLVSFYEHPRFEDGFKTTLETQRVEITDQETGRRESTKIYKVTTDIEEAMDYAGLILVALPSFGQELFFNTMAPYLKNGQVVVLMTGNFGSLRLWKLLREKSIDREVSICETNTMPYGARLFAPAKVKVLFTYCSGHTWLTARITDTPSKRFLVSAMPARDTNTALEDFLRLYPAYTPTKNALVTALNNPNFVGHPAASVLNAGRIEYANLYLKCDFRLHREGHTPSVQRLEDGISDEITAIVRALGAEVIPIKGSTKNYFELCQTHDTAIQPRTLKDRYIIEDVPYGLVPISELGAKFGVSTRLINAIIDIASVLNEEDYRKTGRTLKMVGLDKLKKKQIIHLVENGI